MRRRAENRRHARAVVRQELGAVLDAQPAWQAQRAVEMARMQRARGVCKYCGIDGGGHTADCPVIS